jgi:hypothetical protein
MQEYLVPNIMNAGKSPCPSEPGDAAAWPHGGVGAARLRDADWVAPLSAGEALPRSSHDTQLLYRWPLTPEQRATGLLFHPLDGNPRHGVLALFVDGGELHGAIEVVERQGRWLIMPDGLRARTVAVAAMAQPGDRPVPQSSISGTPDRRFIFFNARVEGGTATLAERRRDGGIALT